MSNTNTIETSSSFSIHPPNHPPNQSNPFCNVVAQKFAFSSQSSVRTSPLSWVRKFASFAFWPVIHRIGLLSTWWEIVFQIIIFPTICSTDEGDECSLFFFLSSSCTAIQFLPTQQMISFLIAQSHTMIAIIIIVLHSGQSTLPNYWSFLSGWLDWCSIQFIQLNSFYADGNDNDCYYSIRFGYNSMTIKAIKFCIAELPNCIQATNDKIANLCTITRIVHAKLNGINR